MDLDPVEVRVLGCLIEKRRVTPDAYPLSLNALRLACNQSTNRDPVVRYDEETIRAALHKLGRRRWTRLASGHTSRAAKYRHLLDDELRLEPGAMAVLAVLMLRGDQTPGELKQRTERMHAFSDLGAVQDAMEALIARGLALRLERRPGQKEERYAHRLSDDLDEADAVAVTPVAAAPAPPPRPAATAAPTASAAPPGPAAPVPARDERLERLERAVEELQGDARLERLERAVAELQAGLAALREELGA